ncbi:MAG: PLDc N-terminal domain-containing protein [Candidatus Izemoplasma sp.]|nr:PLDc N-terminal domain-containing protein [Candidatus Izemoplasma sp.]
MFEGLLGLLHFILVIYTLYVLFTGPNPKNLNKIIWALIVIFFPLIGVILYWIIEKKVLG